MTPQRSCCSASRATGTEQQEQPAPEPSTAQEQSPSEPSTAAERSPSRPPGMTLLPGGTFLMGIAAGDGYAADGEGPVREIRLAPFLIDTTTVTDEAFAEFVDATGWVTLAE